MRRLLLLVVCGYDFLFGLWRKLAGVLAQRGNQDRPRPTVKLCLEGFELEERITPSTLYLESGCVSRTRCSEWQFRLGCYQRLQRSNVL